MTTIRKPKATPAAPVRCAVYTRKSTEEGPDQDFNSLDANLGRPGGTRNPRSVG
jgi:hypothetical protein